MTTVLHLKLLNRRLKVLKSVVSNRSKILPSLFDWSKSKYILNDLTNPLDTD